MPRANAIRIGILGAGSLGGSLAAVFTAAGHEVTIGSGEPERAAILAARHGCRAAPTYAGAAADADLTFLSVAWPWARDVVSQLALPQGSILVDATNPETEDSRGLTVGLETSGAEQLQALTPAPVLKAFNATYGEVLTSGRIPSRDVSIFFCGDDDRGKAMLAELIESCGFDAVDCGGLRVARFLEPLAMLMVQLVRERGEPSDATAMTLTRPRRAR